MSCYKHIYHDNTTNWKQPLPSKKTGQTTLKPELDYLDRSLNRYLNLFTADKITVSVSEDLSREWHCIYSDIFSSSNRRRFYPMDCCESKIAQCSKYFKP